MIVSTLQDKKEYRTNDIQEICVLFYCGKEPFIFPVAKAKQKGREVSACQKIDLGLKDQTSLFTLKKTSIIFCEEMCVSWNRKNIGFKKTGTRSQIYKDTDTSVGLDYWLM